MKKSGHFVVLDGLRGVAALSVVCLHASFKVGVQPFPHRAYLAVDFFFMLSGFVIAKSYEERLKSTLSFVFFAKIRLIRLYPLIALGTLIGAFSVFAHIHLGAEAAGMTYKDLVISILLGMLVLPFGPVGIGTMPLDEPLWSIMFELFINFVYAGIVKALSSRRLVATVVVSAIAMAAQTYFAGSASFGNADGNILLGFARVSVSFFFGVLLFRMFASGLFDQFFRLPPSLLVVVLIVSFWPPDFRLGWAYDLGCILLLFPAIIVAGSVDNISVPWTPVATWAGRLSYPVYVLHEPIIEHLAHLQYAGEGLRISGLVFAMILVLVVSFVVLVAYDEPIRKMLVGRTKKPQICPDVLTS